MDPRYCGGTEAELTRVGWKAWCPSLKKPRAQPLFRPLIDLDQNAMWRGVVQRSSCIPMLPWPYVAMGGGSLQRTMPGLILK